jgi:hypothetical protein
MPARRATDKHNDRMVFVDASLKKALLADTLAVLASALTLLASAGCGGGSELDDYADGVPDVVPAPVSVSKGETGAACTTADDCDGTDSSTGQCASTMNLSALVNNVAFTGGYCTSSCSTPAECPTGSSCLSTPRRCIATCVTDADCRSTEGYKCQSAPSGGGGLKYCLPPLPSNPLGGLLGGLFGRETP